MTTNEVSIFIQTQSLNQTLTRCLAKTTTIIVTLFTQFIINIKTLKGSGKRPSNDIPGNNIRSGNV
jgi:hypothetical protein